MGLPKLSTLITVAGGCGIGVGCMGLLLLKERDNLTNRSNFITRAVELLKQQEVTSELLGQELKVGKATLGDGWSKMDKLQVRVRVPIKGEKDNAFLYVYARRNNVDERLRLYKLEATFGNVANKKLILMDLTNQEESVDEPAEASRPASAAAAAAATTKEERELSSEEKRRKYVEEMKSWQPKR